MARNGLVMYGWLLFVRCILTLDLNSYYPSDFSMTVADSPYIVNQDTVFGANLVIENGAKIIFNDNVDIEVRNNLNIGCNDIDTTQFTTRGLANPTTYTHIYSNITKATALNLGFTLGDHNVMGRVLVKSNSNSHEMKICNTKFSSLWMALRIYVPQYTDTIVDNCEFTDDLYVTQYEPSATGITTYVTDTVITDVKYLSNRGNAIYQNNYISDYTQFCVNANNMCFDISVRHCTISRSKTDTDTSQKCLVTKNYIGDYATAIYNNSFADCGTAIWTSSPTQSASYYYVDNTFTNIADKGIWFTGAQINVYITGNHFESNDLGTAVSVSGSSLYGSNVTMTNNVFVNNNASAYIVYIGMSGLGALVVDDNIFVNNNAFSAVVDLQCGKTTEFTNNIMKNNAITASLTYMDALSYSAYDGVILGSIESHQISSVLFQGNVFEGNEWFAASVLVKIYNADVAIRYNTFNDTANRGGVRVIGNERSVQIEYNSFGFQGTTGKAIVVGEYPKLIDSNRSDITIQFNNFWDSDHWTYFIFSEQVSEGVAAINVDYNYFDALQDINDITNKTAGQCTDASALYYIDSFIDLTFDALYIEPIDIDFANGAIREYPVSWCLDSAFNCTYGGSISTSNCGQVTRAPTAESHPPTGSPTNNPTGSPTNNPTRLGTSNHTVSFSPTDAPISTASPTNMPSSPPTYDPSSSPSYAPTYMPTRSPTKNPTLSPSVDPTRSPSIDPTRSPSVDPTLSPTETTDFGSFVSRIGPSFPMCFISFFVTLYYFFV
eukprot:607261_1